MINEKLINNSLEDEFIIQCVSAFFDSRSKELINDLAQKNLNWKEIIISSSKNNILPIIYANINSICPEAIPNDYLHNLRDNFYSRTKYNLLITSEMIKILQIFDSIDIIAIPYKGPVLAHIAYGSLSLRQFNNLDIIIPKLDIPLALKTLTSGDYTLETSSKNNDSIYF